MRRIAKPDKITKVIPQVTRFAALQRSDSTASRSVYSFAWTPAARSCFTSPQLYFAATSECVMACTDKAMRFCTPTLRINFATCAFTVRSSIPN